MTYNGPRRSHQAGFTLLEAIVAMVLVGTAGMALFSWINGSMSSLFAVQEANARSEATSNALEFMERVNPMLTPEGKASLGAYSLEWRTQPESPVIDALDGGGIGIYQVALYGTEVSLRSSGGKPWFQLQMKQVGYKQVRSGLILD